MITDTARANEATQQLIATVSFPEGSSSENHYREALALMGYLIENDDKNPLTEHCLH